MQSHSQLCKFFAFVFSHAVCPAFDICNGDAFSLDYSVFFSFSTFFYYNTLHFVKYANQEPQIEIMSTTKALINGLLHRGCCLVLVLCFI